MQNSINYERSMRCIVKAPLKEECTEIILSASELISGRCRSFQVFRDSYMKDPQKSRARSRESYMKDPEKGRADTATRSREIYEKDLEKSG